ncbi:hypothetical protein K8T06_01185 [bacterium]|nr:hypothetical protein [bacterium]
MRNRCGWKKDGLNTTYYKELAIVLPQLRNNGIAKKFWTVFRHGLLHQVTMNQIYEGDLIYSELTRDIPSLVYHEHKDAFSLNPIWLSNKVIKLIENDFNTFTGGTDSKKPLPDEDRSLDFDSTSAETPYFKSNFKIRIENKDESEGSDHV